MIRFIIISILYPLLLPVCPESALLICPSVANTVVGSSCNGKSIGTVAFKLDRNKTILPLCVGVHDTLDIILDTGMTFDGVYLFHQEDQSYFGQDELDSVRVGGAGSGEATYALMADSMSLMFGDVSFNNQLVVISQSQTTQGFPTDGVAGHTFFGSHVVHMDYDEMLIRLYDPKEFAVDTMWHQVPMRLEKGVPFVDGQVSISGEDLIPIVLYIDSAAGDALELLVRETMKFMLPENLNEQYLGTGLSGDVHGGIGTISACRIGDYTLHDVPTSFAPATVRSKQEGADGIVGNNILRRFNVIFDYGDTVLHMRPNETFGVPFFSDRQH